MQRNGVFAVSSARHRRRRIAASWWTLRVAHRDKLVNQVNAASFDRAAGLRVGRERSRLLTAIVVGGGSTGVQGFGELLSRRMFVALLSRIEAARPRFVIGAGQRIEFCQKWSERTVARVVKWLERRGAHVHLNTLSIDRPMCCVIAQLHARIPDLFAD